MDGQGLWLPTTYPLPLTDSTCGISISSLASPTLRRELPGDYDFQPAEKNRENDRTSFSGELRQDVESRRRL